MQLTHSLKFRVGQRRENEGVVILSHFDKIYVTHLLKLGVGSKNRKRGSGYT